LHRCAHTTCGCVMSATCHPCSPKCCLCDLGQTRLKPALWQLSRRQWFAEVGDLIVTSVLLCWSFSSVVALSHRPRPLLTLVVKWYRQLNAS
jgi:hypothetical protein